MIPLPQKSTMVGVALAAGVAYAGEKELAAPPLHVVHGILLLVATLVAVALILADDDKAFAAIGKLAATAGPLLPWGKKDGAP